MCLDHQQKLLKYAEESVKIGAKVLWLQLGIRSVEAKEVSRK